MKKDWLEDVIECVKDERITMKQSFQIYTNFSFVDHKVQMKLKEQRSVSITELDNTLLKIDISNVIIERRLYLDELTFDENKYQTGFFDVDLIFGKKVDESIDKIKLSSILSKDAQLICDYFKHTISYLGFSIIIVPSSLWVHVRRGEVWKKLVQIGTSTPPNTPCSEEDLKNFLDKLPKVVNNIEKCFQDKKLMKLLDILNTALRLEQNQLIRDAYLNYYNIIETIFRDKKFREKLVKRLDKPKEYINVLGQCNQRLQMLFICEFFIAEPEEGFDKLKVKDFIEVADTRNNLSHKSDGEIKPKHLLLAKLIMFKLFEYFLEIKE